jgi:type 1 glutamine amidotransferase
MNKERVFTLFEKKYSGHLDALLDSIEIHRNYSFDIYSTIHKIDLLDIRKYKILLIYLNKKTINDTLFNRIHDFIMNGGGMIAFHSMTNSFRNQDEFYKIIGARFIRHGKMTKYLAEPKNKKDSRLFGTNGFEIEDELFRQKYNDSIKIHYVFKGTKIEEPLVWSNTYGNGLSIGISPGHRIETMKNKGIQEIVCNSLKIIKNGHKV